MIECALSLVWLTASSFDHARPGVDASQMAFLGITAFALTAAALAAYWLAHRNKGSFWENSAARLFHDLCRAHGLPGSSRRLLKRLAAARHAADPAMLFVEPHYFDARSLPSELRSSADAVRKLRSQLFGGEETAHLAGANGVGSRKLRNKGTPTPSLKPLI